MIVAPLQEAIYDINDWAQETENILRSTAPLHSGKLANSIKNKVRSRNGEPYAIAFNFARYGAWLEKGAGRGHGGTVGSSWYDRFKNKKTTNPLSFGKMGEGNRPAQPWFDPVIDQRFPYLADLVALHYARTLVRYIHMK
jgi:hypothetical protein